MNEATMLAREFSIAVFRLNGTLIHTGNALVGDLEITSALWQILDALAQSSDPLSVASIARNMGLARQSVQRGVDILYTRGMLEFFPNQHHKRAKLVSLTALGTLMLASAQERSRPDAEILVKQVGIQALIEAIALLRKIDNLLSSSPNYRNE